MERIDELRPAVVYSAIPYGVVLLAAFAPWASLAAQSNDREVLRDRIAQLSASDEPAVDGAPIATVRGISQLYELRGYEPAWADRATVRQLHDQVRRAVEHGLDPNDFHLRQIEARLDAGSRANDPVYRADTEILFTDAFVRLGVTLKFGKLDPTAFDPAWNFSREIGGRDPVTVFDEVLNSGDISTVLDSIAPTLPGYPRLRRALADYRVILVQGGWTQVPDGPTLELGSNGSRVVALRDRLKVTGDLQGTDPTDPTVFDVALDAAVKRFQRRLGVTADGKVGQRSLEELNVPVEARIDQIRANLERARWVFRDIEDSYIIADIAGYRLDLVEEGERSWSTNVQVGKPYHATPVFKSRLQYIEFNPTWTIPPGILRNEILPAIRRDTSYLSRNNMSVLTNSGTIVDPTTIDWAATAEGGFPYIIRQEPGTSNALGQVKFIFPNKYAVYLHDTPSRGLFARTERAFSHGCIRTQNPFDLAERLLDDQGWDRARVDSVTESRETTRVYLETPVTVMLLYWTAQANADGTVRFRKDLYDRDARIIEGLAEPFRVDPPEGVGG